MPQLIRLVLVDDHQVVRQGTRDMISQEEGFEVIAESSFGKDLEYLLKEHSPEAVLLDINLPDINGLSCLETLKPQFPDVRFILFSAHNELQYIIKAKNMGADGFLSKTIDSKTLVHLISTIVNSPQDTQEFLLSDDLAKILHQGTCTSTNRLTPREQEILIHLAKGLSNQAIAKQLYLSVKTVDTHVSNLLRKLDAKKRTQLVSHAFEQGFV